MGDVNPTLATAAIFRGVPTGAVEALTAQLHRVEFARGRTVFRECDPGDELFIIIEGKAKVARRGDHRDQNVLALLGPGDMFGELALFDPGRKHDRVRTHVSRALRRERASCHRR